MRRQLSSAARIDLADGRTGAAQGVPNSAAGLQVGDDFGELIPVGSRELEVIETYLGALLDALLRGLE